jgi:chromosome partitioning protein
VFAVAVCNQKGGVGKTTSTLNLASAATAAGMSVLVIDMDPQCNASQVLGWTRASDGYTVLDALSSDDVSAADAIHETSWQGVSLLPAVNALAALEAPSTTPALCARSWSRSLRTTTSS